MHKEYTLVFMKHFDSEYNMTAKLYHVFNGLALTSADCMRVSKIHARGNIRIVFHIPESLHGSIDTVKTARNFCQYLESEGEYYE